MKKKQPKQAFTLIELLTVIAIIGILASILIPTVGRVRESARRTVDASNIRQIGQASLIYANDNREQLPPRGGSNRDGLDAEGQLVDSQQTPSIHAIAAALARGGGLNDASIWISTSDGNPNVNPNGQTTILEGNTTKTVTQEFEDSGLSFAYIAGLNTSQSSSTPIAYTRGLAPNGKWIATGNMGVYGDDGGHIVFIGGNVDFYKDTGLTEEDGIFTQTGASAGERTNNILKAFSSAQASYSDPNGPGTSSTGGTPGQGD